MGVRGGGERGEERGRGERRGGRGERRGKRGGERRGRRGDIQVNYEHRTNLEDIELRMRQQFLPKKASTWLSRDLPPRVIIPETLK
jgi:hypothetical protein